MELTAVDDQYHTWNISEPKNSIGGALYQTLPVMQYKILSNGVGYLAINGEMIKHHKKKFAEAIADLADTPGKQPQL